jgi:hypothetical protein
MGTLRSKLYYTLNKVKQVEEENGSCEEMGGNPRMQ